MNLNLLFIKALVWVGLHVPLESKEFSFTRTMTDSYFVYMFYGTICRTVSCYWIGLFQPLQVQMDLASKSETSEAKLEKKSDNSC